MNKLGKAFRYYRSYGFRDFMAESIKRSALLLRPPRRLLYCVDLTQMGSENTGAGVCVQAYEYKDLITEALREELLENGTVYNKKIGHPGILWDFLDRFFGKGATFWVARKDGVLMGYLWTVRCRQEASFYMVPLFPQDALILAAEVFPPHRNRGVNRAMLLQVLRSLKQQDVRRVYVDAVMSNVATIRSLAKTPFRRAGVVRLRKRPKRYVVEWDKSFFDGNQRLC